jgi:hypothetical protein
MAGLPNFPVKGSILSNSVAEDRISLLTNTVGSSAFPAGQYVFYTKNNSIWYRYKTSVQKWSSEFLYISNGYSSNTKFDSNGFPITAYSLPNGSVNLQHYPGGVQTNLTIASSGTLGTVAIDSSDTYVFFVPPNFNQNLQYTQAYNNFTVISNYSAVLPGNITAMQIQLTHTSDDKERFLFSFECDIINNKKVYVAFTNPNIPFVTYDLNAFITFKSPYYQEEYFVIAEILNKEIFTDTVISQSSSENFAINDIKATDKLTLVRTGINFLPEYFVIAQKSDLEAIADVVASIKMQGETLLIPDDASDFGLTFVPSSNARFPEYFIVAEVPPLVETEKLVKNSANLGNPVFEIEDSGYVFTVHTVTQNNSQVLNDNLIVSDSFTPQYVFDTNTNTNPGSGVGIPIKITQKLQDYFVIQAALASGNFIETIQIIDVNAGNDKLYIEDLQFPSFEYISIVGADIKGLNSGFIIDDSSNSYDLIPNIYYHGNEYFNISEITQTFLTSAYIIPSEQVSEKLQIHEILNIILSTATDFNYFAAEKLYMDFTSLSYDINVSKAASKHYGESFSINEGVIATIDYPPLKADFPQDAVPYLYKKAFPATQILSASIFMSSSDTVPTFYYYIGNGYVELPGPKDYSLVITEPTVIHTLTEYTG